MASLVATVLSLRLHHTAANESMRMSPLLRKIFLEKLPKLLFMDKIRQATQPPKVCTMMQRFLAKINDSIAQSTLLTEVEMPSERDVLNAKLDSLIVELKFLADCKRSEESNAKYQEEWKMAAIVFDRLCCLLFTVTLIITLIYTTVRLYLEG